MFTMRLSTNKQIFKKKKKVKLISVGHINVYELLCSLFKNS